MARVMAFALHHNRSLQQGGGIRQNLVIGRQVHGAFAAFRLLFKPRCAADALPYAKACRHVRRVAAIPHNLQQRVQAPHNLQECVLAHAINNGIQRRVKEQRAPEAV